MTAWMEALGYFAVFACVAIAIGFYFGRKRSKSALKKDAKSPKQESANEPKKNGKSRSEPTKKNVYSDDNLSDVEAQRRNPTTSTKVWRVSFVDDFDEWSTDGPVERPASPVPTKRKPKSDSKTKSGKGKPKAKSALKAKANLKPKVKSKTANEPKSEPKSKCSTTSKKVSKAVSVPKLKSKAKPKSKLTSNSKSEISWQTETESQDQETLKSGSHFKPTIAAKSTNDEKPEVFFDNELPLCVVWPAGKAGSELSFSSLDNFKDNATSTSSSSSNDTTWISEWDSPTSPDSMVLSVSISSSLPNSDVSVWVTSGQNAIYHHEKHVTLSDYDENGRTQTRAHHQYQHVNAYGDDKYSIQGLNITSHSLSENGNYQAESKVRYLHESNNGEDETYSVLQGADITENGYRTEDGHYQGQVDMRYNRLEGFARHGDRPDFRGLEITAHADNDDGIYSGEAALRYTHMNGLPGAEDVATANSTANYKFSGYHPDMY